MARIEVGWRSIAVVAIAATCACGDDGGDGGVDAARADAAIVDAPTDAAGDDAAAIDAPVDGPGVDAAPADAEPPLPVRLRIVAANLTSGSGQAYEAPGIRILDGLDPDVALVQEFNAGSNTAADLRGFVDQAFGPGFGFARENGVQLPNGVVSRYPIRGSGTWDDPQVSNRGFTWARIDVPGPRDLWAVSIHLLTSSATNRDAEAQALAAYVAANVPPGDLLVIGGDLNTAARTEAAITTLGGVVDTAGPHPRDQAGNEFTNAGRTKPYDWVMPDADLAPYVVTVDIGAASFADGLVFDTRVFTPLDDVAPALVTDSAAPSMQHMAVVKDFVITE